MVAVGSLTEERTVCTNIGPAERRKRMWFGAQMLIVSLVVAAVMIAFGVERAWRVALFFPFASAMTGFFQAFEKT